MLSKPRIFILGLAGSVWLGSASAQNADQNDPVETEIRRLDRAEAEGLLNKDLAALERI